MPRAVGGTQAIQTLIWVDRVFSPLLYQLRSPCLGQCPHQKKESQGKQRASDLQHKGQAFGSKVGGRGTENGTGDGEGHRRKIGRSLMAIKGEQKMRVPMRPLSRLMPPPAPISTPPQGSDYEGTGPWNHGEAKGEGGGGKIKHPEAESRRERPR